MTTETAETVDREEAVRAARAVLLAVQIDGPDSFTVRGGEAAHRVTLEPLHCDCQDHAIRGRLCKHILAVMLRRGEPAGWRALREFIRGVLPTSGRVHA